MIFRSGFRRDLGRSFGATLVLLLIIVVTVLLIRTLRQVATGRVNPTEIVQVLGLTVLGYSPIILVLSLFIAATSALSRMYADSEMVIWQTAGLSLSDFIRPLYTFAAPILAIIALLTLIGWSWSGAQLRALQYRYQQRNDVDRVAPGQFQQTSSGSRVLYIDRNAENDAGSHLFVASFENERQSVITALAGRTFMQNDWRVLQLDYGQRLEKQLSDGALRLSEFVSYGAVLENLAPDYQTRFHVRSVDTLSLLRNPIAVYQGEFFWRVGLIVSAALCLLLSLAMTRVNPRVGRSAGIMWAILTFIVYFNMMNIGQSWITDGRISALSMFALLHGGVLIFSLIWLRKRQRLFFRGCP